jgi:hypothetical protein
MVFLLPLGFYMLREMIAPGLFENYPPMSALTMSDLIKRSDYVIIAKGQKIHWIKSGQPIEVAGPSLPDGGHDGPQLLEAEIVSTLHCIVRCPKAGKVIITLYGYSGFVGSEKRAQDGHELINQEMIYLVQEARFDVEQVYPKQLIGPWNVEVTAVRTVYPMSAKAEIEKVLN